MNNSGWLFLLVSWGVILGLNAFCLYKVFKRKKF